MSSTHSFDPIIILCVKENRTVDTKPGLLVNNVGDIVDVDLDICSFGPAGMELRAALGGKHIRIALDAAH
jgi:hypothetical protein